MTRWRVVGALESAGCESFHSRWVVGSNDPEYREMTGWLREFVDEWGAAASSEIRERMHDVFALTTRYEYLFWDAA